MIILEWLIYAAFLSFGGWVLVKTTLAFINEKRGKRGKQKTHKNIKLSSMQPECDRHIDGS